MNRLTRNGLNYVARYVSLFACMTVGVSPVHAQEDEKSHAQEDVPVTATDEPTAEPVESKHDSVSLLLDEIVVTATRTPMRSFDAPYSTVTLDQQLLNRRTYRTTPEAMRDIPGIMVQKTSHGQGSPFIRGFTGFRNVFLIDGIRLNNSVFRDGPNQYWNTVDSYSIDRLEVTKGSSSVLYGSDAIGGTVGALTLRPYSYGEGVHVNGRALYRYSSAEDSNVGRAELSVGAGHRFGLLLGLTGKDFGDVKAGGSTDLQRNTGYREYDIDVKSEFFLSETARLVFAYQRVRQNNVPRTHKTTASKSFRGTTLGKERRRDLDQERNLAYVQFHAEELDGPFRELHASVSWQVQEETRDRIRSSGARDLQGFEVGTLGLWVQASSDTPIGVVTYGGEYYRDTISSFSTRNSIQGPIADDAKYDLLGLYVQDTINFSDRLTLIAGGRFSYARVDANSVQDPQTGNRISIQDDWSSFVGSGRLTFAAVPEHLNIFGGISQGFRAPNLSDLTRLDSNRTNEIETPAPGLDPERFISYEIGLKAHGSWLSGWSTTASFFYTDISDMIIRAPTGQIVDMENEVTKRNAGDGFVQGIEFAAQVHPHPD